MATRANLYGASQIVLGDKTSHGGVVISGSPTNSWHGIPVARKQDRVYCPKCRPHFFEIAEGLENCTDTNAALPLATEGHLTTCGAVLIAQTAGAEAIRHAMQDHTRERAYDQRFQVLDEVNKTPAANRRYRITYSGGVVESITDENGLTATVRSDSPEPVNLEML